MKYNYVVKAASEVEVEKEETVTVSLEKNLGDFNLVLHKTDGAKCTVLGLHPGSAGLVAVRWSTGVMMVDRFGVDRDSSSRIVDLFKNDK